MRKVLGGILLLLTALFFFQHCTSDKSPPPSENPCDEESTISYQADIKPIFENNCAKSGCHNQVGNAQYAFTDYEGISNGVTKGRVLGAINHKEGFYNMPAGGNKLPDTTICKVETWAEEGAPDN